MGSGECGVKSGEWGVIKSKLSGYAVEVVGLFGICLVETLRSHLELQILHRLDDMVFPLEDDDLLIANRIVAFLIVEIE